MDPVRITAKELVENIERYRRLALTQPVEVTVDRTESIVMISATEYQRLKRRDRRVMTLDDFTDQDIALLEATEAPEESRKFDREIVS